ncbi:MAG: reprolysin-like metallopeptidase, partial [Dokdonella sp.]
KRNYRAAVAANHQYVQAIAAAMAPPATPTVALGLAGVVAAVNRVNQPYGQDFSIQLSLIATNDQLIFPDAVGDTFGSTSFNNGNPGAITGALNGIVGVSSYDIGHLFTTGSGGVAGLGVVCGSSKGSGTTGLTNGSTLQTDVFYIDYVAHEMGHQFGGNHTFNGSASNCGGGNRSANSAYEPGSGSTIQAYAGICGLTNDLQAHSDPYFHARSLLEMGTYSTTGNGGSCSTNTPKVDAPPVVLAQNSYTIPANTPYVLTGAAASIALGSNLTYGWEQYDLGAANNNLATDLGTGPIQRSWLPTTTPRRYLPRLSNLLAGTTAIGEILPTTTRTMTYRLTVRDNVAGGGSSNSADQILSVVNTAGPFVVTAPIIGTNWASGGAPVMISWNVAMTNVSPVSCANVNIDLVNADASQDNLIVLSSLASGVANSGTAMVAVPNLTVTARVRVACATNIFFNLSPPVSIGADSIFKNGFDSTPPGP